MAAENGTPAKGEGKTEASVGRKPGVTLDLEAQTTSGATQAARETEAEGDEVAATLSTKPVRGPPGIVALIIAGIAGGVVALALGYGLQTAGVLPAPGETAANEARAETEALKDTVSGLDQRVTSIEAASAQAIADRARLDDLSRQVGVVDAFGESLSDRLLQAEAAIAALPDAAADEVTKQTLDALSDRVTRLETAPPPTAADDQSSSALAELGKRLDAVEAALAKAEPSEPAPAETATAPLSAGDDPAARAATLAAFQRAAAGGGPFADAVDRLDALGIDPTTIASLKPLAEKGAPSRDQFTAAFPAVAEAILAANPATEEDAGLFDRLASYGRSLVKVRPSGSQQSEVAPESIVARMRAAVDAGDLAAALEERKALPADGQAASQAWAEAVADRLEIDRLAEAITAPPDTDNSSG